MKSFVSRIQLAPGWIVNYGSMINTGKARPARACQGNWNKIRLSCRTGRRNPGESRMQISLFAGGSERKLH